LENEIDGKSKKVFGALIWVGANDLDRGGKSKERRSQPYAKPVGSFGLGRKRN